MQRGSLTRPVFKQIKYEIPAGQTGSFRLQVGRIFEEIVEAAVDKDEWFYVLILLEDNRAKSNKLISKIVYCYVYTLSSNRSSRRPSIPETFSLTVFIRSTKAGECSVLSHSTLFRSSRIANPTPSDQYVDSVSILKPYKALNLPLYSKENYQEDFSSLV